MKIKNLLSGCIILSVLYFTSYGCNNNPVNSSSVRRAAMTELDFKNSNLQAAPGSVIVVELEDLNSPPDSIFDTDVIGIDAIPIKYTETAEHTFRLDESSISDYSATAYEMTLVNAETKEELFTINTIFSHITRSIPAGNYVMVFKSTRPYGADSTGSQIIFIQPDNSGSGNTDYDEDQLKHFMSTRECNGCDLSNADLSHMWVSNVSLVGANLNGGKFDFTEFENSNLSGASIQNALFRYAVFNNADFSHIDFKGSQILSTRFIGVNFTGSDFSNASLKGSTFSYVTFYNTNFTNAELSNAVFDYTNKLSAVNMKNANLAGAKFSDHEIPGSDFSFSNLTGANFSNLDISGSDFSFSNMTSATFNIINARGVNFCGAIKDRINQRMVFTDESTACWP